MARIGDHDDALYTSTRDLLELLQSLGMKSVDLDEYVWGDISAFLRRISRLDD
jgi:hypothetical protein